MILQTVEDVKLALDGYMSSLKILPKDWPEEQKIDPPSNFTKKGKITDEMEEEIDEDRRYNLVSNVFKICIKIPLGYLKMHENIINLLSLALNSKP